MSIESRKHQYGKLFDHWQIKSRLGGGSGGRTAVFRMERTDGYRGVCALKVVSLIEEEGDLSQLSPQQRTEYEENRRKVSKSAEDEVRLMDTLSGKTNIVDYRDHVFVDWSDENGFGRDLLIQMELLQDLRSKIKQRQLSEKEILKIGKDICRALVICHSKNILHRDIKPENIFENQDGDYKLGDFGISRVLDSCTGAYASTGICTIQYCPSEQLSGKYDKRVDIYSLGLVLYELCNENRLPFAQNIWATNEEVFRRISGKPLPIPTKASKGLCSVIMKACAFQPEERYSSAEEFLAALERVEQDSYQTIIHDDGPIKDGPGKDPPPRLPWKILLAIAAVAILAVGIIAVAASRKNADSLDAQQVFESAQTVETEGQKPEATEVSAQSEPEATQAPPVPSASFADAEPGDVITFGSYRAAGDTGGKDEPIQWIVLEKGTDSLLLLSRYGLDTQPYHTGTEVITWDESGIRQWLNGYFLSKAFSQQEKQQILFSTVTAEKVWDCSPGETTEDRIFLLSQGDVNQYIKENTWLQHKNEILCCEPSASVGTQDIFVDEYGNGWWWLRNTSRNNTVAFRVNRSGGIDTEGYALKQGRGLIRPAIRITIEPSAAETETQPVQIQSLAAGRDHTVVLYSDGTVRSAGGNVCGQGDTSGWRDIVQISSSWLHTVGVKADGTVVATGLNTDGQCRVDTWTDIIAVSAGDEHTVGLRSDGTVVAVGNNQYGECDVQGWTDVVAVKTAFTNTIGLCADGTVLVTGSFSRGKLSGWTDIVEICASDSHFLGLRADGTVKAAGTNNHGQCDVQDWKNMAQLCAGAGYTIGLKENGTLVIKGINDQGQHAVTHWDGVRQIVSGMEHVVALLEDGTLIAAGANDNGQCDVRKLNPAAGR